MNAGAVNRIPACAGYLLLAVCLMTARPVAAEVDIQDINEGELHFLTELPPVPPHHQATTVTITPQSLKTGWVEARQCHYQLDRVGALEVVYRASRVRQLRILRADNIERAWVEKDSVQLENIRADAVLCIASENRVLRYDRQRGMYRWRGGPYMRRFLDGFFPMRVTLELNYPESLLHLREIEPHELKLKAVTTPGHVRLDTIFEGRLLIDMRFSGPEIAGGIGWETEQ